MSDMTSQTRSQSVRSVIARISLVSAVAVVAFVPATAVLARASAEHLTSGRHLAALSGASATTTVWLCRPGMANDPCTSSLTTTVVSGSGERSITNARTNAGSRFDCFYIYPTVSGEAFTNADLVVQKSEIDVAIAQASRFSTLCRVYTPMYRQITLAGLETLTTASTASDVIAYDSIRAGFEDYLAHYNHGRPIIFIGHSQGAAMSILLLEHLVDNEATLRKRLVLAIIAGGNVVVPTGSLVGASFKHIPVCTALGETGCVIAYSTFPGEPPASALFGRPGAGVSLLSGQTAKRGLEVVCANPAALGGGSGELAPYFPTEGLLSTPWVEYPNLYSARCENSGGASYLQVVKSSGPSDHRHLVTETDGPNWGYHPYDVNLALGNLVADTARTEATWSKQAHHT